MIAIALILIFTIYMICFFPYDPKAKPSDGHSPKFNMQMDKLWSVAKTSMKTSKNARAERALLSILKFDETNAAAYNRLGILYAKSQKFDEAIECFEIAQSLDDNPSSLHNVGLIYLETGSFDKAVIAFEQAIELEGDVATRYIALAKAYEKLGRRKDALESLEDAYELDHSVTTLRQMLALHEEAEDQEAIAATAARIEQQLAKNAEKRAAKSQKSSTKKTSVKNQPRRILRRPTTPRKPIKPTPTKAVTPKTVRKPAVPKRRMVNAAPRARATTKRAVVQPRKAASTPSTKRPHNKLIS